MSSDPVHIPARQNGRSSPGQYTDRLTDALSYDEPEAVAPEVLTEFVRRNHETFSALKGEELARREARSRAERLAAAEYACRKAGGQHEPHVKAIERHIEAMRSQAKEAA